MQPQPPCNGLLIRTHWFSQVCCLPVAALVKELQMHFAIAYTRDDFETVIAMLGQQRIDASAMITDVVTLEDMPSAFEALRSPTSQCKVLTEL